MRTVKESDRTKLITVMKRLREAAELLEELFADSPIQLSLGDEPTAKETSTPLWEAYCDEFQTRFKKDPPPRNQVINSQLKTLLKRFGKDKGVEIVRHYFKIPKPLYTQKFYDIGMLVLHAHEIYASMTTGIHITNTQAKNMERSATVRSTLSQIDEGKI
jgi:hypothetical protein